MSQSKIGSKLANSLRNVRGNPGNSTKASSAAKPAGKTKPKAGVASKRSRGTKSGSSNSAKNEQFPRDNLDQPWENLFPDRIWPD